MLRKVLGFFKRNTLTLTTEEMGQVQTLPGDMQVPEALWREWLRQNPGLYKTIQERNKARNAWHACWIAAREYYRAKR